MKQQLGVLWVFAAAALAGRAAAGAGEKAAALPALPDVRAVVRKCRHAVVRVEAREHYVAGLARRAGRLAYPFPMSRTLKEALSLALFSPALVIPQLRRHLGAGVVFDAQGYLLTNHHVVRDADRVWVRLTDAKGVKRKFRARIVATDRQTDIALLKITPGDTPLVAAPLGDSEALEVGDWIVAIGNPMSLTGSVSVGVVGGLHRQLGATVVEDHVQVVAALNPGNSGGPILNTRGEVVGIVALAVFPSNSIGFAVPTGLIEPYLGQMKKRGRPRRGHLGVTLKEVTPELVKRRRLSADKGAYVESVSWWSPASRAGIEEGDVIVAYQGKAIQSPRDLQMAVLRTLPGTRVTVTVRRGDRVVERRAKLRRRRIPFRIF